MTVTTPIAEAESYAARAVREGRFADAAASYQEAADNNPGITVATQTQDAADLALAVAMRTRSGMATEYQMGILGGAGTFAASFAKIIQTWADGTGGLFVGFGSFSANGTRRVFSGGSLVGSGSIVLASPIQKWVGGNSASLVGSGKITGFAS